MVATGAQTARTRLPPVSPIAPVPIAPVPQTARTARASTPLTGRLLVDRVPAVMQPELLKLTPTGELATSLLPALDGPSPRGRRGSHFSAFGDGDHDSSRGATPPIGPPAYLKELGLFRGDRHWLFHEGHKKATIAESLERALQQGRRAPQDMWSKAQDHLGTDLLGGKGRRRKESVKPRGPRRGSFLAKVSTEILHFEDSETASPISPALLDLPTSPLDLRSPAKWSVSSRDSELEKRVKQIQWFKNMPMHEVRDLLHRSRHRLSPKYSTIIREGCVGSTFYVLLKGTVQCTTTGGLDVTLHAGASFGEGALLTSVRREATVTTSEACHLLQIVAADLTGLTVEWQDLKDHVIAQMLQKVRFFAPLPRDKRVRAARLLQIEYFSENQIIFEQGDPGDKFYILNEGRVGIFLGKLSEDEIDLRGRGILVASKAAVGGLLSLAVKHNASSDAPRPAKPNVGATDPYPWFGEAALLSGSGAARAATAIALEPTKLLSLGQRGYAEFLREFPSFVTVFSTTSKGYAEINKIKRRESIMAAMALAPPLK